MAGDVDIVERLRRAVSVGDYPFYYDDHGEMILHEDTMSEAADTITALRSRIEELERERDEARAKAFEEAGEWHDDMAAKHSADRRVSNHHEMMAREHRRFASAIRSLGKERTAPVENGEKP